MIHPIRLYGDPILRRPAAPVRTFDDALARLAADMIETMHDANGVGLAAPQIGVGSRLFVALELAEPAQDDPEADAGDAARDGGAGQTADGEDGDEESRVVAEHVMVNPEITARDGMRVAPDGCLSVPGLWIEDMRRDQRVRVRYQDVGGTARELEAEGHFAHVIQHELDHLDGVLFFDRLPDEERRRFLEAHRRELAELQREAKAFLKELRGRSVDAR